ncbi:MAG: hypothetical protein GX414_00345 [Acidobacteria bacterium]|nr:hypothetical protein [Acidobacteriota bacterium]
MTQPPDVAWRRFTFGLLPIVLLFAWAASSGCRPEPRRDWAGLSAAAAQAGDWHVEGRTWLENPAASPNGRYPGYDRGRLEGWRHGDRLTLTRREPDGLAEIVIIEGLQARGFVVHHFIRFFDGRTEGTRFTCADPGELYDNWPVAALLVDAADGYPWLGKAGQPRPTPAPEPFPHRRAPTVWFRLTLRRDPPPGFSEYLDFRLGLSPRDGLVRTAVGALRENPKDPGAEILHRVVVFDRVTVRPIGPAEGLLPADAARAAWWDAVMNRAIPPPRPLILANP